MKRIFSALCIIIALAFLLGSCGYNDYRSKISKALGIDIPSGTPMKSIDTHGGFNGDGATWVSIGFTSGKNPIEQIKNNSDWKQLPLDEVAEFLAHDLKIQLDKGEASLMPDVENGYYIVIDRHSQKNENDDILGRASYNFTIAIYDTDANILYYCEFDT